jgi:hypothetical protein
LRVAYVITSIVPLEGLITVGISGYPNRAGEFPDAVWIARESRTTERIYARYSPEYLRGASDALNMGGGAVLIEGKKGVLSGRSDLHTGDGIADLGEKIEVAEGVPGLAFRNRAEQRGNVGIALDVGLLREVEVPTVRLALSGEGFLQIVVRLASLEIRH